MPNETDRKLSAMEEAEQNQRSFETGRYTREQLRRFLREGLDAADASGHDRSDRNSYALGYLVERVHISDELE